MSDYLGTHILLDLYDCDAALDNDKFIAELMVSAAIKAKTTVLNCFCHKFSPQGVSCVVVISESHLSIHTWPEYRHAQVDIFTCGTNALPTVAASYIQEILKSGHTVLNQRPRGETRLISLYDQVEAHACLKASI